MTTYSMYQHYKPLRNHLAKYSVLSGLRVVWLHTRQHSWAGLQQKLQDASCSMLPWELEQVVRELVLNGILAVGGSHGGKELDPMAAVRCLRTLIEAISRDHVHCSKDAMEALVPLIHQQNAWSDDAFSRIVRHFRIFRHEALAAIVEPEIGISLSDWLKIGLTVSSFLNEKFEVDRALFNRVPGVDPEAVERFFELTAMPIEGLRQQLQLAQRYDLQWAHTFNPLRARPIIFRSTAPGPIFSPIPQLLLWRLTDGLYYELVHKRLAGFDKAFGDACEHYVGEVLNAALRGGAFDVRDERPYKAGKQDKHGVDWVVSDRTGHLFVECKAKRMTLAAKTNAPGGAVDKDLRVLAGYIVQNYKNINDALQGHVPVFLSAGLPVFSAIVTLEDWGLHTPHLKARLHSFVDEALHATDLPISMMNDCPYAVLSFFQLERRAQDIAKVDIATAFTPGAVYTRAQYKGCLFPQTLKELMPDIAEQAGFDRLR